ncbi:hypothetical protein N7528_003371 [Penicillium herquei]|nr:hypothetical protein N7528_003371 [Penicillium herquei]
MLSSSLLEDDMVGDSPSLDQFRKACVLAFYEFHQFPGHQSWKRIGNLARLAYRIGLDRLEGIRAMYPDWRCLSLDDIQEWRSIWWCIYRLDTYSNISTGTPFLIDPEFTNTSLILDSSASDPNPQELFLPAGFEDLWRLIPTITANPETLMRNIHIISIAATREAGSVARAFLCRRNSDFSTRLANTEKHLSTLLLALPQGWFNPRRNAFSNESHDFCYGRSITVLHFLMTRFLLAIVGCGQEKGEAWFISWQKVLGICQDISAAVAQWDNSFFMKVDPAISFIIFTALIFFDLHKKSATAAAGLDEIAASDLCSAIEHQQNVLRLQLEQFAKFWMLPRLLCCTSTCILYKCAESSDPAFSIFRWI